MSAQEQQKLGASGKEVRRLCWAGVLGCDCEPVSVDRAIEFRTDIQQLSSAKAKSGDVDAMLKVAQAYESGSGIQPDPAEAALV
jgi:TPR repeat protein